MLHKTQILLIFSLIISSSCADPQDSSSNQVVSIGDCRNNGLSCNQGFTCSLNAYGSYECLPSQTSTQNSDSGQVNEQESVSYNESSNSSSNTNYESSESNITCCYEGQPYRCPDAAEKEKCFRGEPNFCSYDSSVSCGGSGSNDSSGQTGNDGGGNNRCLEVGDLCQAYGDCCNDALCDGGICRALCGYDSDCQSGCCKETVVEGRSFGVCSPQSACGSSDPQTNTCFAMVWCAAERCDSVGNGSSECYAECISGPETETDKALDVLSCVLAARNLSIVCDLSSFENSTPECLLNECFDQWSACLRE